MKWREFLKAEEGVALAYFAVALPGFLAMAAMVVDVGRGNNLQYDLQRAVDGLAVAAAAELDGNSDAIERADRAISNLVKNQARFGNGAPTIVDQTGVRVFYLDAIPESDDDPVDNTWISTHDRRDTPSEARFAAVFAEPVEYSLLFPISFVGFDSVQTGASAVAGYSAGICNVAPMFICNPYEGTGTTLKEGITDPAIRRKMIVMRQKGPSSAWAPGNFGYLRADAGNSSGSALRDLFARVTPSGCFGKDGVYLNTGQTSTIRVGFNVRFDRYDGSMSGKKNDVEYRPARSVRKQYKGASACNTDFTTDSGYRRLRRDTCFATNSCTEMGGRMGNGMWDFVDYWDTNFPGVAHPTVDGITWANDSAHLPSRYQVYRYEIDNNLTTTRSIGSNPSNPNGEMGAPRCYGGGAGTLSDTPDRRLLYAAIINCVEHADLMNGSSGGAIPVEEFASVFVTEPLENGGGGGSSEDNGDDSIRAELVDIASEFGNGTLQAFQRDDALLFR